MLILVLISSAVAPIILNTLLLIVLTLRVALSDCIWSDSIAIQEVLELLVMLILDLAARNTAVLLC